MGGLCGKQSEGLLLATHFERTFLCPEIKLKVCVFGINTQSLKTAVQVWDPTKKLSQLRRRSMANVLVPVYTHLCLRDSPPLRIQTTIRVISGNSIDTQDARIACRNADCVVFAFDSCALATFKWFNDNMELLHELFPKGFNNPVQLAFNYPKTDSLRFSQTDHYLKVTGLRLASIEMADKAEISDFMNSLVSQLALARHNADRMPARNQIN